MSDRVENLIAFLESTKNSLFYGCRCLGFDESELTREELDSLYDKIFQCDYCERWEPADESFRDYEFGFVCGECYERLNDMDITEERER